METILNLWNIAAPIIEGVSLIVTGATMIAVLTPTPKDDAILAKVRSLIDWLAGNFGHNK